MTLYNKRGELLTPLSAAAKQLGIERCTLTSQAYHGRTGQKIEGRWYLTESDIAAYKVIQDKAKRRRKGGK